MAEFVAVVVVVSTVAGVVQEAMSRVGVLVHSCTPLCDSSSDVLGLVGESDVVWLACVEYAPAAMSFC